MHLLDSYPSLEKLKAAPVEDVGSAIVLHMQKISPRISPHEFIHNLHRHYSFAGDIYGIFSEAFEWGRQHLLIVKDLSQTGADRYMLSRVGKNFTPDLLPRLKAERMLPGDVIHNHLRTDVLSIFQAGKYEAAVFEAFKI